MGHGVQVPSLQARISAERVIPVFLELVRNRPPQFRAAQSHTHQVSLVLFRRPIGKPIASVQNREVVDEMHIAGLGLDLQLQLSSNLLDHIESFYLCLTECRKVLVPGVNCIAHERSTGEVHHQSRLVVEEQWSALKAWPNMIPISQVPCPIGSVLIYLQCDWPVRLGERSNNVGTVGRELIVDAVDRSNDTATP